MSHYVIGDIQGCFDPLMRLLDHIHFDESVDELWCVGDLVNRGPQSLEVLHFLKSLKKPPRITLGNHDLHLLAKLFSVHTWSNADDTLSPILESPDAFSLGYWLKQQSILYYDENLNVVMVHAGIPPIWNLETAILRAKELENALRCDDFAIFLNALYGNEPVGWCDTLTGIPRLRAITNYFTRMRFCNVKGELDLTSKGDPAVCPLGYYPWFEVPGRFVIKPHVVFGHWAALKGRYLSPTLHALDTGCLWGGVLTALRLEDRERFFVSCQS